MQRDSRMSVKVYGICKSRRQYGCPKHTFDIETNVEYCSPLEGVLAHEDGSHDRSAHDGAHNAPNAHLPCLFAFSCASIDSCHEEDNIQRSRDVEDLETEVPEAEEAMEVAEQVQVSYDEDEAIQRLSDEGYT
jgi:hypothetical protein